MTVNAWTGTIGAQDRAGYGAERALKTRGDAVSVRGDDVWRISDLSSFGRKAVPNDIGRRLRAHAASRTGGNGSPADTDWHDPQPTVSLDRGDWSSQKWHTVTLSNTAGLR